MHKIKKKHKYTAQIKNKLLDLYLPPMSSTGLLLHGLSQCLLAVMNNQIERLSGNLLEQKDILISKASKINSKIQSADILSLNYSFIREQLASQNFMYDSNYFIFH